MTQPSATPPETPQLTAEEIAVLKSIVQGHKAITWLSTRTRGIAAWIAVLVGAAIAVLQLIENWPKGGSGQ